MDGFFDIDHLLGNGGYLAGVADNDWFGSLASICLLVAMAGLFPKVYSSRTYRVMAIVSLLFMPLIHLIGSYYLNQPAAR